MFFLCCFSVIADFSDCKMHEYIISITIEKGKAHLCQPPADGTGALGAEVEGEVLLALVEVTQVLALLLVRDGQNAGNRLADTVATS